MRNMWLSVFRKIVLVIYIGILFYFVFLSEGYGRTRSDRAYQYNIFLFKEIHRFMEYRKIIGTIPVLLNLAGNVGLFIPFGFLLPFVNQERYRLFLTVILSFQLSLFIEIMQLIFKRGSFDVDDLLLNTLGGLAGYVLFGCINYIRRKYYGKTL